MVQQQEIDETENTTHVNHQQDDVRILMLGDPGVGKTSLIYTLVNDEFEPNVSPRMANITIPANVIPDKVFINISDYNENEQTHDELREAIADANVICVVYIAGDSDSLDKVASYWIPTIRKSSISNTYKPIILVANKVDLMKEEESLDRVSSFIQTFVEIEAFIEVSALAQKNVVELFYTAQKAVTCPLAPLFDPHLRVLTKKCQSALANIFDLCDLDGDGLLSDHEINLFQETCFGTPLQRDALDDLKSITKQSITEGIVNDCMTQTGFLFLHTLSIDRGRHDFTWQVLRKFNYDNQLNNTSENVNPTEDIQADDLSPRGSFSSILNDKDVSRFHSSSRISDADDDDDFGRLDSSWIREHSNIIKAGLGLTIATLISMLAFRYLVRGNARGSI